MRRAIFFILIVVCFIVSFLFTIGIKKPLPTKTLTEQQEGGNAWRAFQWWYAQRALPYDLIPQDAFQKAARYAKTSMKRELLFSKSADASSQWVSLGPDNVGGRVLSLEIGRAHV